jgi:glyoxylase-like metal-dependent hydrolase (beta-lactamase superfamily II)
MQGQPPQKKKMQLYTINTGYFKLDGGAMFGVVPKQIWNKLQPADDNNLCTWAMRCMLIVDGERRILVDTGIGEKQDAKFLGHYHLHGDESLSDSLKKAGFTENDITDVILTHLHFDHCGGAIKKDGDQLVPTFPNAIYWSNERHWNWATHPNDREKASFLKENILPLEASGKLKMIAIDDTKPTRFTDNISIRIANGHTAAMMLPQIKYKDKTIVFMADLLPAVAHLPLPYVMAYDMFPLTTLEEKKQFINEAYEKEYILFFEHDPVNECCTLQMTDRGIRQKKTFTLSEL